MCYERVRKSSGNFDADVIFTYYNDTFKAIFSHIKIMLR